MTHKTKYHLACPRCERAGIYFSKGKFRCYKCEINFAPEEVARVETTRTVKYQGQKAGRITIPQYRYGGTRLG